jgi:uncharacterized coiled-coil protein SlyX
MSGEEAEAKLKAATDKVEALESLLEIEQLTRPRHYNAREARELNDWLEEAKREQQAAQQQLDLLTSRTPADH